MDEGKGDLYLLADQNVGVERTRNGTKERAKSAHVLL